MTAPQAATRDCESDRTQLNIAIDRDLHHQLRVQSTLKRQSLREFSERLLRSALNKELSDGGQNIGRSVPVQVNDQP